MNPLSLINLSLDIDYCSTNHDIIKLIKFVPKIKIVPWMGFVINLHLILQISRKKIDVMDSW
jgi:hypothetical protein